jgi:transforming growth factor-beta-induced protein
VYYPPPTYPPTYSPTVAPLATQASVTISGFVFSRDDLSTLQGALVRANLANPLNESQGPFTLFAPNNAAFAPIPEEFRQILFVQDDFIPHLRNLLLFHVLAFAKFSAADLESLAGDSLTTANGEIQPIAFSPLTVAGVPVVEPDNAATNGVVHIISDVLAPSWVFNSITTRVDSDTDLTILFGLLILGEFNLGGIGNAFTLLAPTNAAFNALPAGALDFLLDPVNLVELQTILVYHLIIGVFVVNELVDGLQLPSALASNTTVLVSVSGSTISFNQALLGDSDILTVNGVVQKIGALLSPNDSPTAAGP